MVGLQSPRWVAYNRRNTHLKSQINQIRYNFFDTIDKNNNFIELSNIIIEYSKKAQTNGLFPVLSSTKSGIFLQTEYFNKDTASENTMGYKTIPRNYCTYRAMSDSGRFTFNIQTIVDYGIISPAYPVFTCNNLMHNDYLIEYFNFSKKLRLQILEVKEGGTRFALSLSKLKKLNISIIDKTYQEEYLNMIHTFSKRIELEEKILKLYEKQKDYLLNKMFI